MKFFAPIPGPGRQENKKRPGQTPGKRFSATKKSCRAGQDSMEYRNITENVIPHRLAHKPDRSPAGLVLNEEEHWQGRALTIAKKSKQAMESLLRRGDPLEIRTPDPLLKRQLLYRLS